MLAKARRAGGRLGLGIDELERRRHLLTLAGLRRIHLDRRLKDLHLLVREGLGVIVELHRDAAESVDALGGFLATDAREPRLVHLACGVPTIADIDGRAPVRVNRILRESPQADRLDEAHPAIALPVAKVVRDLAVLGRPTTVLGPARTVEMEAEPGIGFDLRGEQ